MIKDQAVAREVSQNALEATRLLNESVHIVRDRCSEAELIEVRRAVGKAMGEILLSLLNPIFKEHPTIKPPELL
jgi:hypothetical protein